MVEGLEDGHWALRLEGAPLHGRRRVGHRPALGRPRLVDPSRRRRPSRRLAARSRRRRPSARRRGRRRPGAQPLRAAPRASAPRPACPAQAAHAARRGRPRALRSRRRTVAAPPPQSTLNGPIGPHRRWDWARRRSTTSRRCARRSAARSTTSCSPAITGGFRDLLLVARRVGRPGRAARSCRCRCARDDGGAAVGDGTYDNQVSAMFAELPVGIADPVERLAPIRAQMDGLKESKQAVAGEVLTSLVGVRAADAARARHRGSATPASRSATSTRSRPTSPARSSRSTPPAAGCSRRSRTCRSRAASASASRSSPTTAGQLRRHRRLRHGARHRTCWWPGSRLDAGDARCGRGRRAWPPPIPGRRRHHRRRHGRRPGRPRRRLRGPPRGRRPSRRRRRRGPPAAAGNEDEGEAIAVGRSGAGRRRSEALAGANRPRRRLAVVPEATHDGQWPEQRWPIRREPALGQRAAARIHLLRPPAPDGTEKFGVVTRR